MQKLLDVAALCRLEHDNHGRQGIAKNRLRLSLILVDGRLEELHRDGRMSTSYCRRKLVLSFSPRVASLMQQLGRHLAMPDAKRFQRRHWLVCRKLEAKEILPRLDADMTSLAMR